MNRFAQAFEQQRLERREGRYDAAEVLLDQLHKQAHDDAALHVRVHLQTAGLRFEQRRFLDVGFQLAAIPFAVPASWVQKYLGLVRSNL